MPSTSAQPIPAQPFTQHSRHLCIGPGKGRWQGSTHQYFSVKRFLILIRPEHDLSICQVDLTHCLLSWGFRCCFVVCFASVLGPHEHGKVRRRAHAHRLVEMDLMWTRLTNFVRTISRAPLWKSRGIPGKSWNLFFHQYSSGGPFFMALQRFNMVKLLCTHQNLNVRDFLIFDSQTRKA